MYALTPFKRSAAPRGSSSLEARAISISQTRSWWKCSFYSFGRQCLLRLVRNFIRDTNLLNMCLLRGFVTPKSSDKSNKVPQNSTPEMFVHCLEPSCHSSGRQTAVKPLRAPTNTTTTLRSCTKSSLLHCKIPPSNPSCVIATAERHGWIFTREVFSAMLRLVLVPITLGKASLLSTPISIGT